MPRFIVSIASEKTSEELLRYLNEKFLGTVGVSIEPVGPELDKLLDMDSSEQADFLTQLEKFGHFPVEECRGCGDLLDGDRFCVNEDCFYYDHRQEQSE